MRTEMATAWKWWTTRPKWVYYGMYIIGIACLVIGFPSAEAAPVASCGGYEYCIEAEISNIAGVINAGNIQSATAFRNVAHIGDVGGLTQSLTTPGLSGTPAITYTISDLVGCTEGTATTQDTTVSTTYEAFFYTNHFTLTDTTCTGKLRITLSAGLVSQEIWDQMVSFTIQAEQDKDNLNRVCDNSAWAATCDNVVLNAVVLIAPLLVFVALIIWAEMSREPLVYVLAILAGMSAVLLLPTALIPIRLMIVGTMILLGLRAYFAVQENKHRIEESD